MRIILLTQYFDPEPMPRGLAFAKALRDAGYQVEVITGFPNYPGGKVYSGYRIKWRQKEIVDGINITRVALYPSHNASKIKRVLNYMSFAFSSCLYGLLFAKRADIIYVYHPPLTTALSAMIISFFRRTPFVLDIQDMWPDTLKATGMMNNDTVLKIIYQFSSLIYRHAKYITVLSPGFKQLLIQRNVPEKKIAVVYNWCDEAALMNNEVNQENELSSIASFKVIFSGTMGKAQALDIVLQAAKQVEKINSKIQFFFVGGGVELDKLKQLKQSLDIKNVIFLPFRPMNQMSSILQAADILLVHLKNDSLFEITIPSKTQAYLAMGKPILMVIKGDAADLITNAKAGFCVAPGSADDLTKTILEIASLPLQHLNELGDNAKKFYEKELSMNKGVNIFCEIFERSVKN